MKMISRSSVALVDVSFLRDTKRIGKLSELVVATELVRAGYSVSIPIGERCRYDLIIDDGNALARVQVKTGRLRNGAILFNCYSVNSRKAGRLRTYFGAIDFFGVYCPDVEAVYLIPVGDVPRTCFGSLRWLPPKNGQSSRIRWAARYKISSILHSDAIAVGAKELAGVTAPSWKGRRSSVVEHVLGKDEATGSIPVDGST
jgi:Holliday junction resolvase-like predicted endonuclease